MTPRTAAALGWCTACWMASTTSRWIPRPVRGGAGVEGRGLDRTGEGKEGRGRVRVGRDREASSLFQDCREGGAARQKKGRAEKQKRMGWELPAILAEKQNAGCLHHGCPEGTSEVPTKQPSCPWSLTEPSVSAALRGQLVKGTFSVVVKAPFKGQSLRI